MLGEVNVGRQALSWMLGGQTDVWYLLYRWAHYVTKDATRCDDLAAGVGGIGAGGGGNNFEQIEYGAHGQRVPAAAAHAAPPRYDDPPNSVSILDNLFTHEEDLQDDDDCDRGHSVRRRWHHQDEGDDRLHGRIEFRQEEVVESRRYQHRRYNVDQLSNAPLALATPPGGSTGNAAGGPPSVGTGGQQQQQQQHLGAHHAHSQQHSHNLAVISQQQMPLQVMQPSSAPGSPPNSPCTTTSLSPAAGNGYPTTTSSTTTTVLCTQLTTVQTIVEQQTVNNAIDGTVTCDSNWQATKPTVRERNAAMFNNDLMADVRFVVGGANGTTRQIIPAHKYVLATGSSVFYAMFYGGLAECRDEIDVPDVEPAAFLTLLKYLYCDEIQLEADTVLATLYVAKKYIVPHLARACVNYLETSLTAKNACLLLSQSRLFEEPELMQRCWEVIDAQAEMALKSEGFVDIDMSTLESVLGRETLNCKEMNLLDAALSWAGAECTRKDVEPTAPNRRAVLGAALYLIRIPTMTLEEFANGAAQLGILTQQETIDIFFHFTAANKPQLQYPIRPRTGLKSQVCHRFQSCAYRSNQWRYRGRCDSIQFSVDRRIFVVGFGLYGSSNGAADYSARIELKRLGRVLAENNTSFFSDGSSNTFHVYFDNPVQVEPECFYTASAVLEGGELSYFGQEGMSEVTVGPVTFQFQCSSESTNGTGVQGGQIPELIFYGPTVHDEH